jgi:hypothetical protein
MNYAQSITNSGIVDTLIFLVDAGILDRRDLRRLKESRLQLMGKMEKLSRTLQEKEDGAKAAGKNPADALSAHEQRLGKAVEDIFAYKNYYEVSFYWAVEIAQATRPEPMVKKWQGARAFADRIIIAVSDRVLESAHRTIDRAQRRCNRLRYDL